MTITLGLMFSVESGGTDAALTYYLTCQNKTITPSPPPHQPEFGIPLHLGIPGICAQCLEGRWRDGRAVGADKPGEHVAAGEVREREGLVRTCGPRRRRGGGGTAVRGRGMGEFYGGWQSLPPLGGDAPIHDDHCLHVRCLRQRLVRPARSCVSVTACRVGAETEAAAAWAAEPQHRCGPHHNSSEDAPSGSPAAM